MARTAVGFPQLVEVAASTAAILEEHQHGIVLVLVPEAAQHEGDGGAVEGGSELE